MPASNNEYFTLYTQTVISISIGIIGIFTKPKFWIIICNLWSHTLVNNSKLIICFYLWCCINYSMFWLMVQYVLSLLFLFHIKQVAYGAIIKQGNIVFLFENRYSCLSPVFWYQIWNAYACRNQLLNLYIPDVTY